MRKKKFILTFVSLMLLSACGSKDSVSDPVSSNPPSVGSTSVSENSSKPTENLPLEAKVFVDSVNAWIDDELTLEHKNQIDSAYIIYNSLTTESKELSIVIETKAKLDAAKEEFLILYHDYLSQKEAEEAGYAFADEVNKMKDINLLLKDDKDDLEKLNWMYGFLSDTSKALTVVINAKAKLDSLNSKMEELGAMSDKEYLAYEFVTKVNLLPSISELTFSHIDLVNEINKKYEKLDNESKENENVQNAKVKLDSLIVRSEELKVIKAHAESFIDAVYRLPTFDKLKWKDSGQDNQIKACEIAYETLTEEEKAYPGVSSAYNELVATRQAFDNLKEPFDITKFGFSISLGAFNNTTNNYNLRVNFSSGKDPISVLTGYYNLPKDNLRDYAVVYLNMYYEAGAMKNDPLYRFDITDDYNLNINDFIAKLQELEAEGNPKAVSGKGYNFTINIESKCDLYASSDYSGFSVGAVINF
ncbi:MAG: hypothetical protein J1F32_06625 [Erysipelotrichales bacterium]|nr:hypothetical protein [Erysipelotrichales bacterium]